jgi:hypothetical protein
VVVLDHSHFPRDKLCAGWITPQIMASLQLDLSDYARSRVLQPLHGFNSGLVGGRAVAVRYGQAISYGIRRCEFDDYLLRRSGARFRRWAEVRNHCGRSTSSARRWSLGARWAGSARRFNCPSATVSPMSPAVISEFRRTADFRPWTFPILAIWC